MAATAYVAHDKTGEDGAPDSLVAEKRVWIVYIFSFTRSNY